MSSQSFERSACGNICDKSQIGIGALCVARTRPVSGDHLSTHSDVLIHLSAATSPQPRLVVNLPDTLMGNNSASFNLKRKLIFISSFDVKYSGGLSRRGKLMIGFYVLITERRLFDNCLIFQICPFPSDSLAFRMHH